MKISTYNREKTLLYAAKWAQLRNPDYYNFDKIGGDCSNFISQCLYAGCGVMNYKKDVGWYYASLHNRSAAWSSVPYLYRFLTTNQSTGPYASEASPALLEPGDLIQLGHANGHWYHSLLLIKKEDGEFFVAAHSDDAYQRPLSTYFREQTRYLHIIGYRQ